MKRTLFICLLMLIGGTQALFAQQDQDDFGKIMEEIDEKISDMMLQLDGSIFDGGFQMDSLLIDPFERLQGDVQLFQLDADNFEEVFKEMMNMMNDQMKSLDGQDWAEFEEFFKQFGQDSPHLKPNTPPNTDDPQPSTTKKRKTVDL